MTPTAPTRLHPPLLMCRLRAALRPFEPPRYYQGMSDNELLSIFGAEVPADDLPASGGERRALLRSICQKFSLSIALDSGVSLDEKFVEDVEVWRQVVEERRPMLLTFEEGEHLSFIPVLRVLQSPDENAAGEWVVQVGCPNDDLLPFLDEQEAEKLGELPFTILRGANLGTVYLRAAAWYERASRREALRFRAWLERKVSFIPAFPAEDFIPRGKGVSFYPLGDDTFAAALWKVHDRYLVRVSNQHGAFSLILPLRKSSDQEADSLAFTYFANLLDYLGLVKACHFKLVAQK